MRDKDKGDASVGNPAEHELAKSRLDPMAAAAFGAGDAEATGQASEEAYLLHALQLMHRKQHIEELSAVDKAFLAGAAELFRALASACDEVLKRPGVKKSTAKRKGARSR